MKKRQTIILASQSPYRKKQLKDFGFKFKTVASNIDENKLKKIIRNPQKLALALSLQKAQKVQERFPNDIIIGCDQLVALGSEILGKPGTKEKARRQLKKMSGKTHKLISAITILNKNKVTQDCVVAKIKMRKLSANEISIYVDRDEPLDCAGSYRFESGAYSLIQKMSVSDPSSLIGTPMISLNNSLRKIIYPRSILEFY